MKAKHKVYFNLHKKCLSVQYKGKVIDHAKSICLKDVEFKVSQAGRARVLREKRKNVHAFVVGDVSLNRPPMYYLRKYSDKYTEFERRVTYNPYKYNSFVYSDTFEPVYKVKWAGVINRDIFVLN